MDQRATPSLTFEEAFNRIDESGNVNDAIVAMRDVYGVSHLTYHHAQTVAGTIDAPFVRTTYPAEWVARYLLKGYVAIDPIVREGMQRSLPFLWSDVEATPEAGDMLADAVRHGLGPYGYSIPITDRARRRALLSINDTSRPDWPDYVASHREGWSELAHAIHRKALFELYGEHDPAPPLSPREIECLHWTALGKDAKAIAILLSISDHTARDYLKSARFKLNCATLSQAVTKAIKLRMINP
jgi:LuxR family transcriptional regulator, quorum-sensing system regulator CinR